MQTYEYILIALSVGQLLTMIIGGYKLFRDPDEKADKSLTVLSTSCVLKHNRIDEMFKEMKEVISTINSSLLLIKENDIKHIETIEAALGAAYKKDYGKKVQHIKAVFTQSKI